MKIITLGLAAMLAFSAAQVQAAGPVTFTITAESGAGALTPTYSNTNSLFSGSEKLNVQTVLRDESYISGSYRYVYHYADSTYDQQGGYQDSTHWSVYKADVAQAPDYIYFKASAEISPDADQTVPMTVKLYSTAGGTYSSVTDPRFPNVNLLPASATVAVANSHNAADLTTAPYSYTWFNADGTFDVSNFADIVVPAGGTADMAVLFYLPAQLHATSYSFDLTGPLYNEGLHHFSETNYLGYEILPVPEPSTWAMLLAGVGIVGVARRRKTAA
ncbi:PEPxxWA-CTERM sorting domain-containing protein [Pseudoduganella plicata]|uniref:PEP-CTERM sorting domain-containing protein n=1 Tax=Pseudoduganella plicata TaxID=321984 RepID=A0A4P7BGB5_9BURK|nr:PEPxxWA-CTERM sorting domain-containing protein [Pseudoduganella plicata]QBQ37283.1 PEP-CTERM sorting domain-containing protein [Pseudoduganella plicata]GGY97879.1 hypothetical protein GCM10007388_34200 [Pseudoduganella plicata]